MRRTIFSCNPFRVVSSRTTRFTVNGSPIHLRGAFRSCSFFTGKKTEATTNLAKCANNNSLSQEELGFESGFRFTQDRLHEDSKKGEKLEWVT
jgi:hypothetical protein